MRESENIYGALVSIQADLDAIGRDTQARGLPYAFRSADDVTNAVHPLLVKHGVVCVPIADNPTITDYTSGKGSRMLHGVLPVTFRYYAMDGSFVEARTIGEGADTSDKTLNKCMTQARKAADCLVFTIATDDLDPESERPNLDDAPPEDMGSGRDMRGTDQQFAPSKPRPQQPLDKIKRPLANEKQKKMLYAVSMSRADAIMDDCAAHDKALKHQEQAVLAASIRKHAALSQKVDREAIHSDEISPLKDAIERAEIDAEGDTIIPTKAF